MAEPFIGEIRMFGLNFAPRGWSFCNGQLLPIAQNTALFSLLGNQFGGDGRVTFGLPDLQGRVPMHVQGTQLRQGMKVGQEAVTLSINELANHTHPVNASAAAASSQSSGQDDNSIWADADQLVYHTATNLVSMNPGVVNAVGSGQPHTNLQPSLVINFCIALEGIYPSRS